MQFTLESLVALKKRKEIFLRVIKCRKITEVLLIKNTTVCKVVLQQNLEFDKNQGKADKVIDKK